jgi:ArsR family transcriptional regulator, arsenate/arsenite/antimonite-responsive transcriptional repressor
MFLVRDGKEAKGRIPVGALCCPPVTAGVLEEAEATELAAVLKALADPVRLRLVSLIAAAPSGEICTCDLPALLNRSQPTVSHHVTQLVRAGLLEREQRGKWAWFSIRPEGFAALRAALGEGSAAASPAVAATVNGG